MRQRKLIRLLALLFAFTLVAAACGDDDDGEETATTDEPTETTAGGGDATTTAPATTAAEGGTDTTAGGGEAGACGEPDSSVDEINGEGAGEFVALLECSAAEPLAAEGEPILIGVHTAEGDPAGSFPEYQAGIRAAVEYINAELGGFGADLANGVPGRPVELQVCTTAINPADSQRCANELAGADPFAVISAINFFGNHYEVFDAAGIPTIILLPITVADFTGNGYGITGGGGCLGVHTGLIEFVTNDLGAGRVAVPWADTPPGVVCYYDLESKPLDVLKGVIPGDAERAGSLPDLEHIGVPILPATPDVTPQATEVLDFDPDVIVFSAQGSDCWNLVDGLGRLGWTPDSIPLVLSTSCVDFNAMDAAGDLANGVYFVGSAGNILNDPATIEDPVQALEAEIYQTKAAEYGMPQEELVKTFGAQGFSGVLSMWERASTVVQEGGELTPESFQEAFAATDGQHQFGQTPVSCSTAPAPYTAVCNATVTASQWDGTNLVPVKERFSGLDLVAGTEIRTGP